MMSRFSDEKAYSTLVVRVFSESSYALVGAKSAFASVVGFVNHSNAGRGWTATAGGSLAVREESGRQALGSRQGGMGRDVGRTPRHELLAEARGPGDRVGEGGVDRPAPVVARGAADPAREEAEVVHVRDSLRREDSNDAGDRLLRVVHHLKRGAAQPRDGDGDERGGGRGHGGRGTRLRAVLGDARDTRDELDARDDADARDAWSSRGARSASGARGEDAESKTRGARTTRAHARARARGRRGSWTTPRGIRRIRRDERGESSDSARLGSHAAITWRAPVREPRASSARALGRRRRARRSSLSRGPSARVGRGSTQAATIA